VSAFHVHSRVSLRNDAGFVEIDIEAKDVGSMSAQDREFIAGIVNIFAMLAAPGTVELPDVLRGVGGRP
jgi:hypothetical protein